MKKSFFILLAVIGLMLTSCSEAHAVDDVGFGIELVQQADIPVFVSPFTVVDNVIESSFPINTLVRTSSIELNDMVVVNFTEFNIEHLDPGDQEKRIERQRARFERKRLKYPERYIDGRHWPVRDKAEPDVPIQSPDTVTKIDPGLHTSMTFHDWDFTFLAFIDIPTEVEISTRDKLTKPSGHHPNPIS